MSYQNQSNLEIQSFPLTVSSAGQIVSSVSQRTKIEYKKIKGVAILSNGVFAAKDVQGSIAIELNKKRIISPDYFPKNALEITNSIAMYVAAHPVDIDINTSDVDITFKDESPALGFEAYKVIVMFLCEKR